MDGIGRIGAGGPGAATRRAPGAPGFRVPSDPGAAPAGATARAAGAESLGALLAVQEEASDPARERRARDRAARARAEALLAALGALQRDVLGGTDQGALERLRTLAVRAPAAADPALDAIARAVALRARVELARREALGTFPWHRAEP